ncbi:hypothetical protein CDD81_963 [Ophiocordyceps australis]|uniref:Uncharacterized protein n=1 Tax=Ophiocordyceps australis TaxID=1399860 RepID=A0A2C5XX14_9HYPO|nr:hypothetical protein CDD81_963 [Ophiocordyceps australis]
MPSVRKSKAASKKAANASQIAKIQTQAHQAKVKKAAFRRGARPGLLPTSGPGSSISGKKARKLQRKIGYALKRSMEARGEVEMKDAPEIGIKETREATPAEEKMEGIQ